MKSGFTVLLIVIGVSGCNKTEMKSVPDISGVLRKEQVTFTDVQEAILGPRNCTHCHNGSGLTDLRTFAAVMGNPGLVIAGNPSASRLLQRLLNSSDPMPPSGVLSVVELAIIERWIGDGGHP